MVEPKTTGHNEQSESGDDSPGHKKLIQQVDATPTNEPAITPQQRPPNEQHEHLPSDLLRAFGYFLRHYWDAPRHKAKWTDGGTVILTFFIAIAAFWSACIFQRQLTVARETMEAQTRPWVGNGEIEVKQPTFLVYPDNPIEARTQIDFVIDVPIKNVGSSPALHVEMGLVGTMTEQIAAPPTMETMMESACGFADRSGKSVGEVLFPNSPYTRLEWPVNMMVPLIQINEVHRVWIAVCLTYSGTTSNQQLHHTKLWMACWPINGQPKEVRRTTQPKVIYYSLPITQWSVVKTEAD